jgi:hypothetical protein
MLTKMRPMKSCFWVPIFLPYLLVLVLASPAAAMPGNRVVLLSSNGTGIGQERAHAFKEELSLLLDKISILHVPADGQALKNISVDATTPESIDLIRRSLSDHNASAVFWLIGDVKSIRTLQIFFLSGENILTRTVNFGADITVAEVALNTQALLEQAYDFSRANSTQPKDAESAESEPKGWRLIGESSENTNTAVKEQPSEQPESKNTGDTDSEREHVIEPPKRSSWHLGIEGLATSISGLTETTGPANWLGGGLALSIMPTDSVLLELTVAALGGPLPDEHTTSITGWSLDSELRTGYLWKLKSLMLGPVVGIALPWSTIKIDETGHFPKKTSWWSFRICAGLAARIWTGGAIALDMGATLGVYTSREIFVREIDDATVYETPSLVFGARIGILFFVTS